MAIFVATPKKSLWLYNLYAKLHNLKVIYCKPKKSKKIGGKPIEFIMISEQEEINTTMVNIIKSFF
jgi:hypothetical protein